MKTTEFKHTIFVFSLATLMILSTASICENSNDGGSSNELITYEFESVALKYNIGDIDSSTHMFLNDLGELSVAHYLDGTQTQGTISNLTDILCNAENYDGDKKPCISVTIYPASGGNPYVHNCTKDDVGNNYVQNIPNYGTNINSLIVKVESITTEANQMRLKWSKSFDLNQQWWESIEDTALSGEAKITVAGYTKVMDNGRILVVRMTEEGYYQIVSYAEPELLNEYGVVDCDVEIVSSNSTSSPSIKFRPIFKEGSMDGTLSWSEPEAIML